MYTSAKYFIHADVRTSGVVERSDVVGAIFGQTEGLLGDELDLRDLQDSSKIGRIDVDIQSEAGRTFGTVTVASGLDRVETAVLAAALESIDRIGPCRAEVTVADIEDAREAKRREIVDRATQLLVELEAETLTSDTLVEEVRQRSRVAEIEEFAGLPAGPHVEDSDAIIIVEGRADVRTLLQYGIKNAVAVEGTDVPDAIAGLTQERTVTVFLDGDRGGELILEELIQVGDVDYVAFAPPDQSVEDLDRAAVVAALQKKVPYEQIVEGQSPREMFVPSGDTRPGDLSDDTQPGDLTPEDTTDSQSIAATEPGENEVDTTTEVTSTGSASQNRSDPTGKNRGSLSTDESEKLESDNTEQQETENGQTGEPHTLASHITAVIDGETEQVRLLDDDLQTIDEGRADDAVNFVAESDIVPMVVVIDGPIGQGLLDVAAQRGIDRLIGTDTEEYVKQPANVRIQTADELNVSA